MSGSKSQISRSLASSNFEFTNDYFRNIIKRVGNYREFVIFRTLSRDTFESIKRQSRTLKAFRKRGFLGILNHFYQVVFTPSYTSHTLLPSLSIAPSTNPHPISSCPTFLPSSPIIQPSRLQGSLPQSTPPPLTSTAAEEDHL